MPDADVQLAFPVAVSALTADASPSSAAPATSTAAPAGGQCETSRWAVFAECPHCAGEMAPEHAHYRCTSCGWRDSCCD